MKEVDPAISKEIVAVDVLRDARAEPDVRIFGRNIAVFTFLLCIFVFNEPL